MLMSNIEYPSVFLFKRVSIEISNYTNIQTITMVLYLLYDAKPVRLTVKPHYDDLQESR